MCKCHIRSSRDLEVQRFNAPWEQWAAHSNKIAFPWTDQKNIQLESWNSKLRRQPIVRSALHMAWISCTAALFGRCSESKPNKSNKVEQKKLETWNTKLRDKTYAVCDYPKVCLNCRTRMSLDHTSCQFFCLVGSRPVEHFLHLFTLFALATDSLRHN